MKQLTEYKRNGFHYEVEHRIGMHALAIGIAKLGGKTFEVIEIQSHDGREIGGVSLPPAEYPPSNSQWGVKGWTFQDCASAEKFLKEKALV